MGIFSSRIPRAAEASGEAARAFADAARASGDAANEIRKTAISATGAFDSIQTTVDAIDIASISFSAKVTAAFGAYIAIEGALAQKRIARSLEKIEEHLRCIARHAEAKNNSYLAGNEGFPIQVLKFANKVAGERKSRFILAFHPSNLPDPDIYHRLSNPKSEWTNINPRDCFFQVFHDWSTLVAYVTHIRRMPDYRNSEPICIIFPSNSHSILEDISYDIPVTGRLDPKSVSFHGQLDQNGMPLTWLPAELTVAAVPVYSSTNVSGLGFISLEKRLSSIVVILYLAVIAVMLWGPFEPRPDAQMGFHIAYTMVFCWMIWMGFWDKEVVVRRKRSADGVNLMISRSGKPAKVKEAGKGLFELEGTVTKKLM